MKNVTDRTSNPFGMRPPCERPCTEGGPEAVFGYGDANADVHVIGDHPGVHGGRETGVPFTRSEAGDCLQSVLREVGLLESTGDEPTPASCFLSYLHACCPPDGEAPTEADYATLEPFFDAELRAIAAHVLVPVGERSTRRVLEQYTARGRLIDEGMGALHATELAGSGFLVFPVADPRSWTDRDREAVVEELSALLATDYRQTSDLGRFLATDEPYLVR